MPENTARFNRPSSPLVPAGAPPWVTAELIEQTLRVWQPFYAQQLIPDDALEIIMSADRLFEVVARGRRDEPEKIRRTGTS